MYINLNKKISHAIIIIGSDPMSERKKLFLIVLSLIIIIFSIILLKNYRINSYLSKEYKS